MELLKAKVRCPCKMKFGQGPEGNVRVMERVVRDEIRQCCGGRSEGVGGHRSHYTLLAFGRTWVFYPFYNIRNIAGNICLSAFVLSFLFHV